jgi:hypothetical protein
LRDAALHARARAFPLGLGVLISKGVAGWQRVLAHLMLPGAEDSDVDGVHGADVVAC